jgi:hypothetical protein
MASVSAAKSSYASFTTCPSQSVSRLAQPMAWPQQVAARAAVTCAGALARLACCAVCQRDILATSGRVQQQQQQQAASRATGQYNTSSCYPCISRQEQEQPRVFATCALHSTINNCDQGLPQSSCPAHFKSCMVSNGAANTSFIERTAYLCSGRSPPGCKSQSGSIYHSKC